MKTVSIINLKGGVGKTTSAVTLAHIFSTVFNKRTLLIDLDSQFNASSFFLPSPDTENLEMLDEYVEKILINKEIIPLTRYSVENILTDASFDINNVVYNTEYDNLKIIPSFITLSNAEQYLSSITSAPQQFILKNRLDEIADDFDYCFMDCSPSANLINVNGLVASDEILVALKPDLWSLSGWVIIDQLIRTVQSYSPTVHFLGTFLTMFRSNVLSHRFLEQKVKECMEKYIGINIRMTSLAESTTYTHEPIFDVERYQKGLPQRNGIADDYLDLAKYIIQEA